MIQAGYCPNKAFIPFEEKLKTIVPSGAITFADVKTIFSVFDQVRVVDNYYAYPGSDIQLNGFPNQCYSATVIQFPRGFTSYISIPQVAKMFPTSAIPVPGFYSLNQRFFWYCSSTKPSLIY